jgi:S1-C subfamily serine protease
MRRFTEIVLSLALMFAATDANARGPYGSIKVGNWQGGAFTSDASGELISCSAVSTYKSAITVVVMVGANMSWSLAFTNDNWKLVKNFPLIITFDGQQPFNVSGQILGSNMVGVPMPDNSALINQFRKSKTMSMFAEGQLFQFDMSGTAALLPTLVNCVSKTKSLGVANVGDFSVVLPPKPSVKPVVATAVSPTGASEAKPDKLIDQTGSGFVVSPSGHVVTNQHVVEGCVGDIQGNLTGEAPIKLRLVSSDETNDLALLQAPGSFKDVATIKATAVHSGESVVAIGYPFHGLLTSDFTVTTGIISSLSGVLNDTRFLQISAAVQPGNSGGPLLASSGEVVGVVAAKLNALKFAKATGNIPENINFAIKTGALRDFLDNSVVPYQTSDAKNELKTADIARNARSFTLLVSCKAKKAQTESAKN